MTSENRERGFTLVEALIGMVVLLIGLLGVGTMMQTSLKQNAHSRGMSQAITIAQGEKEKILRGSVDSYTDKDGDGSSGLSDISGADYKRELTVSGVDFDVYINVAEHTPESGMKTFRELVCWQDRSERENVTLSFIAS